MNNASVHLTSSMRLICGGQVIALRLTGKGLLMRVNETYSEAKRQFNVRNQDVLVNAVSALISHGPLLKSAVFISSVSSCF